MSYMVNSASDDRTVNNSNLMRHDYRKLSDDEKAMMVAVKDAGLDFVNLLHKVGKTPVGATMQGSRELSIAQTKIEEAVMWAVKHLTK